MKPRLFAVVACTVSWLASAAQIPVEVKLTGDWEVQVTVPGREEISGSLRIPPPELISVVSEKHERLPLFQPQAGGWAKGAQLVGVRAQETTTPFLLDPASLVLRVSVDTNSSPLLRGADYEVDLAWGTFGLITNSHVEPNRPVFASYRYSKLRIDSIVLTADRQIVLRQGRAQVAAPVPPETEAGERRLANVWLPGRLARLGPQNLFPILEPTYPEPTKLSPTPAERFLPRTMKKLETGEALRILAWGDSVTVGTYLPDWQRNRWQEQFAARLQARFPRAKIELLTEAWGGRNTGSYFAEPTGSEHNYQEKVLAKRPDLLVSEFVNDAGMSPAQVAERYGKISGDFQRIGAEWIILTPHYVRPDWMGLDRERDVDTDPRPYVTGLRRFAAEKNIALADASLRYGRLWRQGIPYSTLMLNSINHPDARGMKLFADALMELFP